MLILGVMCGLHPFEKLINKLVDYVRSSGLLVDVCNSAAKGLRKDYIHMILRQYDPKADQKRPKSAMIDHFTKLNMPEVVETFVMMGHALPSFPIWLIAAFGRLISMLR